MRMVQSFSTSLKDIKVIEENLDRVFNSHCHWLYQNELIVNYNKGKTELMIWNTKVSLFELFCAKKVCQFIKTAYFSDQKMSNT